MESYEKLIDKFCYKNKKSNHYINLLSNIKEKKYFKYITELGYFTLLYYAEDENNNFKSLNLQLIHMHKNVYTFFDYINRVEKNLIKKYKFIKILSDNSGVFVYSPDGICIFKELFFDVVFELYKKTFYEKTFFDLYLRGDSTELDFQTIKIYFDKNQFSCTSRHFLNILFNTLNFIEKISSIFKTNNIISFLSKCEKRIEDYKYIKANIKKI